MDGLRSAIRRIWPDAEPISRESDVLVTSDSGNIRQVRDLRSAISVLGDPWKRLASEPAIIDDYDDETEIPTATNQSA